MSWAALLSALSQVTSFALRPMESMLNQPTGGYMNQKTNSHEQKSEQTRSTITQEKIKHKQKAEEKEVAGKHKNDGQKDHKGAR
jgi:uncharacterized membrane protein YhiD involved in acid resistance